MTSAGKTPSFDAAATRAAMRPARMIGSAHGPAGSTQSPAADWTPDEVVAGHLHDAEFGPLRIAERENEVAAKSPLGHEQENGQLGEAVVLDAQG